MPQPSDAPPASQIPLVVDLDGTLIKTDLLWESLARLLRRNPFSIFQILFWWTRGRACLKTKLATRVVMDGESTNRRMLSMIDSWLSLGRLETLEEVEQAIESVSAQDCRDLLDRLPLPEHEVGVALGPLPENGLS